MPNIGAIDIGSNAIRFAIGSVGPDQKLTIQENVREAIRLGKDVFTQGSISDETIGRAKEAFIKFRNISLEHKVGLMRAVGTSALREASNNQEFIDKVYQASDIKVSIIDGGEEARLVTLAVAKEVDFRKKLALAVDIGGGSIEISLVSDGDIILSDSLKMGTVRLLQLLEEKKRGRKIFNKLVSGYVEGVRRQVEEELGSRKVDLCIGTGGNIEALGNLRTSLLGKEDKTFVKVDELDSLIEHLQSLSYEERIDQLKLRADRADVIIPASIIIQQIVRQVGVKHLTIPHVGLKEGVLLDMVPEVAGIKPGSHKRQVLAFSLELGRQFSFDERHGLTVAKLAMDLFDRLQSLHKQNDEARLLLEIGALLHDIGQCVNINDHHKHSQYLLRSTPFVGLTRRQQDIVSCIARYHRKAPPKDDHETYKDLSSDDREMVRKLAPIVRLAEAMDREHSSYVKSFSLDLKKSEVTISLKGEGDLLLEKWALANKAKLFEEVYKIPVVVEE